jgi:hypothetical protein
MPDQTRFWRRLFVWAALFNFCFGLPIMFATGWCYRVAFRPSVGPADPMALRFWSDFGFAVTLIGVGYYLVSRNVTANHGLVWLGVFAKLFDVTVLTFRYAVGLARPIVLVPALVDGAFMVLFLVFLRQHGRGTFASPTD